MIQLFHIIFRSVSSYDIDNPHISQDIYDGGIRDGLVIHKELQTPVTSGDGERLMAGPHNYYNLKLKHPIFNMSIDSDNNLYLYSDIGTSHTGSVLSSAKFCKKFQVIERPLNLLFFLLHCSIYMII